MSNFMRILPIFFISFSLNSIHCQNLKSNVPSTSISEANEYLQSVCGQSDVESTNDNKIADVKPGEYPWLVAFYKNFKNGQRYICAGSLISAKTVLTAAHCFSDAGLTAEKVSVHLGAYNLSDHNDENVLIRQINSLVIHPDYKSGPGFSDADIALAQISEPVSFTKFIRPICLWSEPRDQSLIVNKSGIIAGWGPKSSNETLLNIPNKVSQNVVSESECISSSPVFSKLTSNRTLCAGGRDGVGPCNGDGGSGLVFNRNERWVLRAVLSAGLNKKGHCDLSEYVVYCDVAQHLKWVQDSMLT